jgi:hypothetical protein
MAKHQFLIQVDCEADEDTMKDYVVHAIADYVGSYPDEDHLLHTIKNIRVDAVEIAIRKK